MEEKKVDFKHSMLRRCNSHDYTLRCIYLITLTLNDRNTPLLGRLEGSIPQTFNLDLTLEQTPDAPRTVPSLLGQRVIHEVYGMHEDFNAIDVHMVQLMPDHLHAIVFVRETIPMPIGKVLARVKARCNKHYWAMLTEAGKLGPKGTCKAPPLFSPGYNDRILTHRGQYENMKRYVRQNPLRAMVKRSRPGLFHIINNVQFCGRTYAAVGNIWLIHQAEKLQVRCHNNTYPENLRRIAQQKEELLAAGRQGAVLVSPCISAGEKEIATAALQAGVPLIVLLENGFSPLFKPAGRYFEACAAGRLLMLAPWPYHTERRQITRTQCLQLNEMAAELCGRFGTGGY